MSKLEELIQRLCPDGVEYKTLSEIKTNIYRGSGITRDQITIDGTPCVHYGEIYTTYDIWFEAVVSFTDETLIQNKKCFEHGDVLFAITGENVAEIAKSCVYVGHEKCLAGGDIVVLKHTQNPKYLAYALSTYEAQSQKSKGKVKSKVVHSSVPAIESIVIPLPPLPVQEEIVRILDKFTALEAELEAELEARKKQYEYYRLQLLSSNEKMQFVKLEEIADFKYGFTDIAKINGAARFIRITDIGDNGKLLATDCRYIDLDSDSEKYLLEKDDILMARTGATYGKTMLFNDDISAVYASFLIRIRFTQDSVLPPYYWHFAQSSLYWNQANKLVSKAGQPQFNANVLKTVIIPVPPVDEQRRIIELLDRFDSLVNDIIQGLPAELAARRKQYEYYRDKLLTFKEKVS